MAAHDPLEPLGLLHRMRLRREQRRLELIYENPRGVRQGRTRRRRRGGYVRQVVWSVVWTLIVVSGAAVVAIRWLA